MTRPSDRAIAKAFWEWRTRSNYFRAKYSASIWVEERAAELDATAAPVVVGEDVMAKAWRNLYIAERMRSIEFEGMSYEMRRAHAEASANDFEDEFRERMAKPAAKTAMGGLTAALAGD